MLSEAQIHFQFYHHLQNVLEAGFFYRGVTFAKAEPEYGQGLVGFADIVVFDNLTRPWLVIEAKKRVTGRYVRSIDPYSPVVVRQAHRYASQIGAPYFATYNGNVLVLFRTDERFVPLLQRKTKSYLVKDAERFAPELLREVIDLETGVGRWDPRENAFVLRLEEFHRRLSGQLSIAINKKTDEDQMFAEMFETWTKDQGWDPDELTKRTFSRQASYLLMNKLVFYEVLQNEPAYSDNIPPLDSKIPEISKRLRQTFDAVIESVDFEAVFEQDPIFDQIPLDIVASDEVNEFIDELGEYDLSKFGSDVIGRLYQKVIPPDERHDLGQYYTPPEICELIVRLTVKNADSHILDPAVGSGGFLVKAYEQIRALKAKQVPVKHEEIMKQLHGIDINRFPAHLTAINLALRDLSSRTESVDVEVSDFFDVMPYQKKMVAEKATVEGRKMVEMMAPSKIDVIVANPPYIRQEKIRDKSKVRKHLLKLGYDISDRSDIYCYFFTHSSEFLKEGGILGFITSNRWLTVRYGKDLRKFLLNNFKVKSFIAFDRQVFEEPLIGTVITILEKCGDKAKRDENVTRFIRFKSGTSLDEVVHKVETDYGRDLFYDDPQLRLVTKLQCGLHKEEKWYKYLYAPAIYFAILSNDKMVPLGELANVSRGITSNANEFFYFRGRESFKDLGIDESFVFPLIKHVRQTEFIELREEDTDWFVLDIHKVVEEALVNEARLGKGSNLAQVVRQALGNKQYQNLLDYIKHGEDMGVDRRPSIRPRKIWFDLGELPKPLIMFPEVYWKKAQVLYNKRGMTLDKRLYSIWPKKEIDPEVLLGILNSDLLLLMREIDGRVEEGQAMNRNSVMVYEAKSLHIPDPRILTREESRRIKMAITTLVENERVSDTETLETLRKELNMAVLSPLGLEDRAKELEKTIQLLLEARVRGGGLYAEVIVEDEETERQQMMRLKGAVVKERRTRKVTLEDFGFKPG